MAVRTIWSIHEVGVERRADFDVFTDEAEAIARAQEFEAAFAGEHYEARPNYIPVKFLLAIPRTQEHFLGFGACFVEDITLPGFRFVEVPSEHAEWQAGRLGSCGCLVGTTSEPFETLADAVEDAEKLLALGLAPRA
jgi:hypothetical protein